MSGLNFSGELAKVKIDQAIGRTIVCEDDVPRRVVEIVHSMAYPWKAIINEKDPDSKMGHFVNMLSLASQILGYAVPSKDAQEAFTRSVRVRFGIQDSSPPRHTH